jgi:hypothetical protein
VPSDDREELVKMVKAAWYRINPLWAEMHTHMQVTSKVGTKWDVNEENKKTLERFKSVDGCVWSRVSFFCQFTV